MSECSRELCSEQAKELLIFDRGRLIEPLPLVFHLHTRHPWIIDAGGRRATLKLPDRRITLETPWATEICQFKDGIDHRYESVWHLECRLPAGTREFDLKTRLIISGGK